MKGLSAPKSLLIQDCEFANFFYPYSNLIQVPPQGANITITQTYFHHLSSCGAAIGNILSSQLLASLQPVFYLKQFKSYDFSANFTHTYAHPVPSSHFSLTVDSSIFEYLDYLFNDTYATPRPDYTTYGTFSHFSRASALHLYSLRIPLIIMNSTFL